MKPSRLLCGFVSELTSCAGLSSPICCNPLKSKVSVFSEPPDAWSKWRFKDKLILSLMCFPNSLSFLVHQQIYHETQKASYEHQSNWMSRIFEIYYNIIVLPKLFIEHTFRCFFPRIPKKPVTEPRLSSGTRKFSN